MTLKSLFLGEGISQRQLFKRRLWPSALALLLFFLYNSVGTAIILQTTKDDYLSAATIRPNYTLHDSLMRKMSFYLGANSPVVLITGILGIVLALEGFSFLSNRKALDFYESQPVSRGAHFRDITINSFLIYIGSGFVTLLTALLLIAGYGGAGLPLFSAIGAGIAKNLACFFACFAIGTLAVMLTGNPIVSALAACVFLGYEGLLRIVIDLLKETFFDTSVSSGMLSHGLLTSPFYFYSLKPWKSAGANLVLGTAVFAASYFCYRTRRHEEAGHAVVFRPVRTVVRIGIAFLGGLTAGFLFAAGTGKVFGLICGVLMTVIMACVMEIIFAYDFKALFNRFPEIVISAVLVVCALLTFLADPFGYDKWVPDAGAVKDAAILSEHYFTNHYYKDGASCRSADFSKEYMHLTDVDAVRELAKYCIHDKPAAADYEYGNFENITVLYRMKNGTQKLRTYSLSADVPAELMDKVIGTQEFREGYFPIYADDYMDQAGNTAAFSYSNFMRETDETGGDYQAFKSAYLKDLETFSLSYIRGHRAVGSVKIIPRLPLTAESAEDEPQPVVFDCQVYEGFDNTVRFLKETGIYLEPVSRDTVSSVIVTTQYTDDMDVSDAPPAEVDKTFKDPEQIGEIIDHSVIKGLSPFSALVKTERLYYVEACPAQPAPGNDSSISVSLSLLEGEVPAFITAS